MSEKIIGYLLLITGIVIMILASFSVYRVFTKQTKPVQIFNTSGINLDLNKLIAGSLPPQAQTQLNSQATQQIIPPELINDSSNIFMHLVLMGFFVSLGYKLSSLGINLLRPIVVKLKSKEVTTEH
ncbi:MAG: hypothetical protein UR52_C0002G0059 [Candidatus Gottesmanbacteria bacterium GW2011_GWA1_34_13]|uniref:Uncharacterized protein n=1 Tax=Candidatus Gottesmanbacteria bacterium GW2011_GWA1_34_13 TaxID=1618434 RepID=A0A0G0B7Y5_9BACT|nr:MAG: hypothetical protein UR52_C0002G0059 [Candidatus Gottesmanbacteria bacterium GW2011_GWA1_34_13]